MISKNSRGARATSTGEQAPARAGVEVELRHLRKSFHEGRSERSVLRDVNASFRAGEFIVLLGRSGSGKSTLLNLIAGLEVPSAGSVRIEATDVSALSEHQRTLFRRHRIGFIFQSYNLIPTLTVEENLLLPLELSVESAAPNQELLLAIRYWEGAVRVHGRSAGRSVAGVGYAELTGYPGAEK